MTNISEIEKFLKFLSPDATHFCCCLMDSQSEKPRPGFGKLFLKIRDIKSNLEAVKDSTLHVTLNQTNAAGHSVGDMEYARVFCMDFDSPLTEKQFKKLQERLSPQMIVESSPNKFHFYWGSEFLAEERWGEWEEVQRGLAGLFGGDINLDQRNHMIRVPGVRRLTKEGTEFVPRIVFISDRAEEPASEFHIRFPELKVAAEKVLAARKAAGVELHKLTLGRVPDLKALANGGVGRNAAVYETAKETAKVLGRELTGEESEEVGMRVNGHFKEPLERKEVINAAKKGSKKGARVTFEKKERNKAALSQMNEAMRELGEPSDFKYERKDAFTKMSPYSELGIAGRVMERFQNLLVRVNREVFAFNPETRMWSNQTKVQDVLRRLVKDVTYDMIHEDEFKEQFVSKKGDFDEARYQGAVSRALSTAQIGRIASFLTSEVSLEEKELFDFDSEPYLLSCSNGFVNLLTSEVRKVEATDYSISNTKVNWNMEAKCPQWQTFIKEVFAENQSPAQMVTFMQEVFGYSLTGSISAQKVFIHHGGGGNGKSKVLTALRKISGKYLTSIGCSTLSKSTSGLSREFERVSVSFEGRRCVIIDDLDTESQWNEAYVKNLTSARIPSRKLYGEEREIPNRAKIHIGCNEKPRTTSENEGLIRRLCFIPYPRQFAGDDGSDARIEAMIESESEGILQWSIRGLLRLQKRGGFEFPEEVLAAVEEYRSENFTQENELIKVIKENFEPHESNLVSRSELEKFIFTASILAGRVGKINPQKLGIILKRAGFETIRRSTSRVTKTLFVKCKRVEFE